MRILVNALPLRQGGGVSYFQQQMAALARVAPELQMHSLISPWAEMRDLPGSTETIFVKSVPSRFAYEQLQIPLRRADLLYCPANFGPMTFRAPIVLTLQNANYYRSGLALPETKQSRPPWKVKANHLAMRRADAIVAISQSLAADVVATVPSVAHKLHVIASGTSEWPETSIPVGLPKRYIAVVASASPHKRVLDAVAGWSQSLDMVQDSASLVVVGELTENQMAQCRATAGRHAPHLAFTGQIASRGKMKWIYENALAMVSMSLLEAFPLTPAEAGAVGCPLVLSDIPPHREATAGNALFVAPRDSRALATALVSRAYAWQQGSRPWRSPVTWDDNARELQRLFHRVSS